MEGEMKSLADDGDDFAPVALVPSGKRSETQVEETETETETSPESGKKKRYGCFKVYFQFVDWIGQLRAAFGSPFLAVVMIVYGVNQGYGSSVKSMAVNYYWKDVQKLQPSSTQALQALASLPWDIKPIYGLITDTFPIAGYQRWPYLAICGLAGSICWWALALVKGLTPLVAAFLLAGAALCTAFPDVVTDAAVAQHSRNTPQFASDLQVRKIQSKLETPAEVLLLFTGVELVVGKHVCWGPLRRTHLRTGSPLLRPQGIVFPPLNSSTDAHRGRMGPSGGSPPAAPLRTQPQVPPPDHQPVHQDGPEPEHLEAGVVHLPLQCDPTVHFFCSCCGRMALTPFAFQGAVSPDISEAMFFWATDKKAGPGFSENFLGLVSAVGYVAMVCGILLYKFQIASCLVGVPDIVLVTRYNLRLGIPDHAFVLGDSILFNVIARVQLMPMLVLSAKLCPPGIEGTIFAFLMSVSNLGGTTATWLGAGLLNLLQVKKDHYTNLWLAVLVRSIMRLLPLLVLRHLVPAGTPDTLVHHLAHEEDGVEDDDPEEKKSPEGVQLLVVS